VYVRVMIRNTICGLAAAEAFETVQNFSTRLNFQGLCVGVRNDDYVKEDH
jgi:hypothetical protein